MAKVWWIQREGPGRLGIMSCPRDKNLFDDLAEAKAQGVEEVISLLTADDVESKRLEGEAESCRSLDLQFKRFGIQDHGVPVVNSGLDDFLSAASKALRNGRSIAVHCNGGKGRSGLIAGALMIMEGAEAEDAMKRMRTARHSRAPETEEQEDWLREFARRYRPLARQASQESNDHRRLATALVVGLVGIAAFAGLVRYARRR